MSRIKGKEIKRKDFEPKLRWIKGRNEFEVLIMDEEGEAWNVFISERDLMRMIKADEVETFSFKEEQGDLDDDTYLGVSFVQAYWYLSRSVLKEVKRANKRNGYPTWVWLKKRVKRGGRKGEISEEEKERLRGIFENKEKILYNCIRHDWLEEYIMMERDVHKFLGEKCPKREELVKKFIEYKNEVL